MPEILDFAVGTIIGNISTAIVLTLVYYNFILFEDYFRVIIWAFLFSQALRGAKENICRLLRYLSRGKEIQRDGLLYSVCTQAIPYFLRGKSNPINGHVEDGEIEGSTQDKVTMLILDNGIFIFAWISAVSIYVRLFSFLSFLQLSLGLIFVGLFVVWILDRRIFYYRLFVTDEVLVSILLISGCFVIGIFVLLYLGTESYMEGSRAATHFSLWIQKNVINDERTRTIWSEQVANGKAMISSAIYSIEGSYNNTMWFGPFKSMVVAYYDTPADAQPEVTALLELPRNMTWIQAVSLAYAQFSDFNLTSVQVSDMTSRGLEYSSMAVASLMQLIFVVVTFIIAFVSIGLKSFFFITSLFYLLSAKWDPVERIVNDLIPIAPEKRPAMVKSLRRAIEGVFFLPMKISSLHAIVSLISFSIVGTDFVFLGTLMTFFISIVPVVPPYLICLPYVFIRLSTSLMTGILLFVVHYFAFTWIDQKLYERSLTSINSYISAMSVAFGVYVFGLEGVVFGPLLVCGVNWAYEISNHGVQAATTEDEDPSSQQNIFASAYKALSGGLRGNLARRFSFDSSTSPENLISVDLEVHSDHDDMDVYVVRYVAQKDWTYDQLIKHMRQTLKVWDVRGLYAKKTNAKILSVKHLYPRELIKVVVQEEPGSSNADESDLSRRPPIHQIRQRIRRKMRLSPGANGAMLITPPRSRRGSYGSPRRSMRLSESGSSSSNIGADTDVADVSVLADEERVEATSPATMETHEEFQAAANASFQAALRGLQTSSEPNDSLATESVSESITDNHVLDTETIPTEPQPPPPSPQPSEKDESKDEKPRHLIQPPTSPIYIKEKVKNLRRHSSIESPDAKTKQGLWKSIFKPN